MPPPAILDPASLESGLVLADRDVIAGVNPHRHEFALLDAIIYANSSDQVYAGYYDVRADGWWARGHIPGRPVFPGVLMIESAAQLASYAIHQMSHAGVFVGLVSVDGAKFRDLVEPPARFVTMARSRGVKHRRCTYDCQGFVGTRMVFEALITGAAM